MFSKLALISSFVILAAATPTPNEPASSCTTGSIQCCNSSGSATDPAIAGLLKTLGIVVQDVTALVGVGCSPISGVGVGGNSCSASPFCCTDSFKGGVAAGCIPVDLSL